MTEPEDLDEDLFADLYEGDETTTYSKPAQQSQGQPSDTTLASQSNSSHTIPAAATNDSSFMKSTQDTAVSSQNADIKQQEEDEYVPGEVEMYGNGQNGDGQESWEDRTHANDYGDGGADHEAHGTGIKEDGKMFIGGLNWETTDQSLKEYFSQFGEVTECTVMRDGASGRSRGFGFLTFKDPRTVNIVMVKEHYLDGKIIDPKRAIPRDEQERTSKIFVGGVSQEATEQDFKEFFMQFGRVLDATLMMDKDTGRPRGFGFVTFDSEAAVDATLVGPLEIHGKPIEVKKAQPRGNIRDRDDDRGDRPFNRHEKRNDRFADRNDDRRGGSTDSTNQSQNNQQGAQGMYGSGMTPQMMAQYYQRLQQYFNIMQQSMMAGRGMGGMGMPAMNQAAMNPAMLQQWQAMMAMGRGQGGPQGSQSPQGVAAMPAMNPAMMQQMQQMQMQQQQQQQQQQLQLQEQQAAQAAQAQAQQAQAQAQQAQQQQLAAQQQAQPPPITQGGYGAGGNMGGGPNRLASPSQPGYNAYEQQLFEQQKYEQQQARRAQREQVQYHQQYQGGPTSWEGMYDDVPQPPLVVPQTGPSAPRGMQQQGGFGRQMSPHGGPSSGGRGGGQGMNRQGSVPQGPQGAPPPNAPTGPKNAGKPGANYRGGGRGAHRGFHPYARNG